MLRNPATAASAQNNFILPQGGDSIPSQTYHDAFVGYTFRRGEGAVGGRVARTIFDGLQVQAGVRNVFDKAPPLDLAATNNNYFTSRYGDLQLRTYWVSVRKQF
ncbi:MAG: hypothetical protein WDM96_09885 [Lacunisphaera sp.]